MKHIWACACGCETEVEREVFDAGSVFQCPDCKRVWGCVVSKAGPKVWIPIEDGLVNFHKLLEEYDQDGNLISTECVHEWEIHREILCSYPGQYQRTCKNCKKYQRKYDNLDGDWFDV